MNYRYLAKTNVKQKGMHSQGIPLLLQLFERGEKQTPSSVQAFAHSQYNVLLRSAINEFQTLHSKSDFTVDIAVEVT